MAVDQNKEQFQGIKSSTESQKKEISLEEIIAECPEGLKSNFAIFGLDQEKEVPIGEIFAKCLGGAEAAALILKENQEQYEEPASSGKPQENDAAPEENLCDSADAGQETAVRPDQNQEQFPMAMPSKTFLGKPDSTLEPFFGSPDVPAQKPVETIKPKLDKELMRSVDQAVIIIPRQFRNRNVHKPKTAPTAAAINKPCQKMIAVGGAKGGVGKSTLAANLAVGLALLGHKVVLADLDLGGADSHLYTGVKNLDKTWNDFLDKKVDSLEDILTPTAFDGLSLIGGDSSRLGSANLPYLQKLKIIRHLKALETDYLIVDLGGDTGYNGLDFFLQADQKIVVSGTEPASVLDSYSFVKVAKKRFLERFFSKHKSLKDLAKQVKNGSLEKSADYSLDLIFQEVRIRYPQALEELKEQFEQFRLAIVLNMTESSNDVRIAESMQKLVKEKCFLDVGILGTIPFDKAVRRAAREFTPIVVENAKCKASRSIHQMLATIIFNHVQEKTETDLLNSTHLIRGGVKEQIDSDKMTLDGLTIEQINSIFNSTPRLRQTFQKIMDVISG